ncbi:rhomboid family intramembrane serine protease [Pelagicoccus sp. NFK12]|uniref:Rhomboid family intramembrane serine protease n=1 Tax=Pelagicoccus enzymogenes TaxID=2773457 RepID=A0A927FCM6_9BACT|nr:rhomboid family intramembrane serine protease [Pelagicoccus enzymogenes]MBD5782394.1 rhomboid family intramembrane serine protease [Pelagicoccus enzymogenes]MDQ8200974.1 rhomboid family intramembrane serine protease [Pelagicoccus enzymogenes]
MARGKLGGLLALVGIIWGAYLVGVVFSLDLSGFGVQPRQWERLYGVLTWPFVHADRTHLMNNSVTLVVFGAIISLRSSSWQFVGLSIMITLYAGLGVWLLGRDATHIGASGLVFGYFGYIMTRGIYDGRISSIVISTGVMLLFGSMIWGILPTDAQVSWEGHLFGFLAGVVLAVRSKSSR